MRNSKLFVVPFIVILLLVQTININAVQSNDVSSLLQLKSEVKKQSAKISSEEQAFLGAYRDTLAIVDVLNADTQKLTANDKQIIKEKVTLLKEIKADISTYKPELVKLQEGAKAAKEKKDMEGAAECLKQMLSWQEKWMKSLDQINAIMEELRKIG